MIRSWIELRFAGTPMGFTALVILGIVTWIAWELAGSLIAGVLAPIFRPLRVLVRPPLGAPFLVLVWLAAGFLAVLGFREPAGSLGVAAFVVATFGLVLALLVRDAYRESKTLPPVRHRFPERLSAIQRIGLVLLAALAAATGAVMLLVIGPSRAETWLTLAGSVGFVIVVGRAAWSGRFSAATADLLGAEIVDDREVGR